METAWDDLDEIKAIFGRLSGPRRLAMASELLRWTVANFSSPIADPAVGDLIARASAAVGEAVDRGAATATDASGLTDAMYEVSEETEERGANEILLSYYLCFDDLAPEIRPDRLTSVFDQCYQADYRRYSESAIVVGDATEFTARERSIFEYQRGLIDRFTR